MNMKPLAAGASFVRLLWREVASEGGAGKGFHFPEKEAFFWMENASERAIERASDRASDRVNDHEQKNQNSSSRRPFETLTSAFYVIFQN